MRKFAIVILLIVSLFTFAACKESVPLSSTVQTSFQVEGDLTPGENKTAKVVLLYGQSNATGVAANDYLRLKAPDIYESVMAGFDNVSINFITENGANSSKGSFVPVTLGQGANQHYFGPEVGMASALHAQFEGQPVFIIKYSWGGSILHNQWLNGQSERGDMYTAAINFTLASLGFLKETGYIPEILAACWMQGESDSIFGKEIAELYYHNTEMFVNYLREDLKGYSKEDFLFIDAGIAEIDIWPEYSIINDAKIRFAETSEYNYYFSTSALGFTTGEEPEGQPDTAHYDACSAYALGVKFASYIS